MISGAALAIFSSGSFGDPFSTEGIQNTPYQFRNFQLAAEPVQTKLPVASWRSVGNSVTGFIMESFIDELAVAAKQDPIALRRTILAPDSRAARVLAAVEKLCGLGDAAAARASAAASRATQAFDTEVAQVAEVELVDNRIRVKKVYCVVDCGIAVNPDVIRAQMEGGIIFGLSAALDQEITLVDGVVQQRNFDTFPLAAHVRSARRSSSRSCRARPSRPASASPACRRSHPRSRTRSSTSPACGSAGCRYNARGASEVHREVRARRLHRSSAAAALASSSRNPTTRSPPASRASSRS